MQGFESRSNKVSVDSMVGISCKETPTSYSALCLKDQHQPWINFFGGWAKPNSDRTKAQLRTGEQPCETREEPRYDGAQRNPQPAGPCTGPANTRSKRPTVLHASSAQGSTDCLRCPCFWLLWYLLWAQEQNQLCDNGFITTVKSSQYPAPKQITAWEKWNGEGRGVNANKSLLGYLRRRGFRF